MGDTLLYSIKSKIDNVNQKNWREIVKMEEIIVCTYCGAEPSASSVENNDGCCPECGTLITPSTIFGSSNSSDLDNYDDEYNDPYDDDKI